MITEDDIRIAGDTCGFYPEVVFDLTLPPETQARLERWQALGYAADLHYMMRPSSLLTSPEALLPGAKSILTFAFPYEARLPTVLRPRNSGRVARYAWGRDYHKVIKKRLQQFVSELEKRRPFKSRIFTDAVPLLERAYAARAKLGFIGKNSMLIQARGGGSFFFIAEILIDTEVTEITPGSSRPSEGSCGTCSRCNVHCPTSAFVEPYVVDAGKCISYLTIEKRGPLSWDERRALGDWVFGCDVCQEVCPFNHRSLTGTEERAAGEFSSQHGAGPYLRLAEILALRTHEQFVKRFAGTALMRAKREGLLRNAACVAGNLGASELQPILEEAFTEDPSPIVRQHALWALSCSKADFRAGAWRACLARAERDPAPEVRGEALALVESGLA